MWESLELQDFKTLVDNAENGYMIADGKGLILYTNRAYLRAVSQIESMVGHYMSEFIENGSIKQSCLLMAIEQKRKVSMVTVTHGANGEKTAYVSSTPYLDENGDVYKVITQARDQTELTELKEQVRLLENQMNKSMFLGGDKPDYGPGVVVMSKKMRGVMELADKVKDVNSTILLLGESGVGKEVVAQYIRNNSIFKDRPFIAVNCSAFSEHLLESELFGYVGGSFTGANKEGKKGLFEAAEDGILFLDEIGEISPRIQVELLRTLEDKSICRVGDYQRIPIHARIITATNKDLKQMVQEKKFREDLYYRLNVISISVPPLRQRTDDIFPLLLFYLHKYNQMYDTDKRFTKAAIQRLQRYNWPGNIRELKNLVERLVVTSGGDLIRESDLLPLRLEQNTSEVDVGENAMSLQFDQLVPLDYAVEEVEKRLLLMAKKKYISSRKMAQHLKVSRATICRKLKKYKISLEEDEETTNI